MEYEERSLLSEKKGEMMNYRFFLNENIEKKIQAYMKELNCKYNWNQVELGFGDANDERFIKLHMNFECTHPKKLYRPGRTLICHFISIKQELINAHEEQQVGEEEWDKICLESRQVSLGVTDAIIYTLETFGREVALLSEIDGWSHLHGAEIVGLGHFEKNGNMVQRGSQIGFLGSVVTEADYAQYK
jgi:hypothetical protein